MIVIDASVVVEVLLRSPAGLSAEARMKAPDQLVIAPHLVDLEVAQVLRKLLFRGEIDAARARAALEDFVELPIVRWPHGPLLPRVWELRHNVSAYDAAYIALAEALDAPLLTRDRRLAAASGHQARIELA